MCKRQFLYIIFSIYLVNTGFIVGQYLSTINTVLYCFQAHYSLATGLSTLDLIQCTNKVQLLRISLLYLPYNILHKLTLLTSVEGEIRSKCFLLTGASRGRETCTKYCIGMS